MDNTKRFERCRSVERNGRPGPPIDQQHLVAVDDAAPPHVEVLALFVCNAPKRRGLAYRVYLLEATGGSHCVHGALAHERGLYRSIGVVVLVEDIS